MSKMHLESLNSQSYDESPEEEFNAKFRDIAKTMGCISCIVENRVYSAESPQGLNYYERYSRIGLPGYEALGTQTPETD